MKMKDITNDYTLDHRRSLPGQFGSSRITTCEICYGTSFKKEEGRMICKKCGQIYWV